MFENKDLSLIALPSPYSNILIGDGNTVYFLGLKKNDKILKINSKPPKNVNDAVSFIKKVVFLPPHISCQISS